MRRSANVRSPVDVDRFDAQSVPAMRSFPAFESMQNRTSRSGDEQTPRPTVRTHEEALHRGSGTKNGGRPPRVRGPEAPEIVDFTVARAIAFHPRRSIGWCPPSRSMIDRRVILMAQGPSTCAEVVWTAVTGNPTHCIERMEPSTSLVRRGTRCRRFNMSGRFRPDPEGPAVRQAQA